MLTEDRPDKFRLAVTCALVLAVGAAANAGPQKSKHSGKTFKAGDCRLQVFSVKLEAAKTGAYTIAPPSLRKDETALTVEAKVISGDAENLAQSSGTMAVWLTDKEGHKFRPQASLADRIAKGEIIAIRWLFTVPKGRKSFSLHSSHGTAVDLTPYFK